MAFFGCLFLIFAMKTTSVAWFVMFAIWASAFFAMAFLISTME